MIRAERVSRFEREARAASALNHPNIITVYDAGITGAVPWIAMELLEGDTLRSVPVAGEKLLETASQIANAVARAHEKATYTVT